MTVGVTSADDTLLFLTLRVCSSRNRLSLSRRAPSDETRAATKEGGKREHEYHPVARAPPRPLRATRPPSRATRRTSGRGRRAVAPFAGGGKRAHEYHLAAIAPRQPPFNVGTTASRRSVHVPHDRDRETACVRGRARVPSAEIEGRERHTRTRYRTSLARHNSLLHSTITDSTDYPPRPTRRFRTAFFARLAGLETILVEIVISRFLGPGIKKRQLPGTPASPHPVKRITTSPANHQLAAVGSTWH